jgi:DNA-binding PadR family transcriptional regulator
MKETRLGDFEEVIMLLIGILGEEYSYAFRIADEFKSQTGRGVSIGAVHSTLSRLEDKGFLESEMGKSSAERGGRRKRIYTITAFGRRVLQESKDFKLSLWQQFPALSLDNLNFSI